jgi:hypothetical protein
MLPAGASPPGGVLRAADGLVVAAVKPEVLVEKVVRPLAVVFPPAVVLRAADERVVAAV